MRIGLVVVPSRQRYVVLVWTIPSVVIQIASAFAADQVSGLAVRPLSLMSAVFAPDLLLVQGIGSLWWTTLPFSSRTPSVLELVTSCFLTVVLLAAGLAAGFKNRERADFILLGLVLVAHFFATAMLALNGAGSLYVGGNFRYYFPLICMVGAWGASVPRVSRPIFRCALAGILFFVVFNSRTAVVQTASIFHIVHPEMERAGEKSREKP